MGDVEYVTFRLAHCGRHLHVAGIIRETVKIKWRQALARSLLMTQVAALPTEPAGRQHLAVSVYCVMCYSETMPALGPVKPLVMRCSVFLPCPVSIIFFFNTGALKD